MRKWFSSVIPFYCSAQWGPTVLPTTIDSETETENKNGFLCSVFLLLSLLYTADPLHKWLSLPGPQTNLWFSSDSLFFKSPRPSVCLCFFVLTVGSDVAASSLLTLSNFVLCSLSLSTISRGKMLITMGLIAVPNCTRTQGSHKYLSLQKFSITIIHS